MILLQTIFFVKNNWISNLILLPSSVDFSLHHHHYCFLQRILLQYQLAYLPRIFRRRLSLQELSSHFYAFKTFPKLSVVDGNILLSSRYFIFSLEWFVENMIRSYMNHISCKKLSLLFFFFWRYRSNFRRDYLWLTFVRSTQQSARRVTRHL